MAAQKPGKLYLIGAGPGDPELLTFKAARVLAECDVVLYDRLVAKETLRYARPGAELIYVGKHQGEQELTQQAIFELIAAHAGDSKIVGRLKGGDPLVFGRGGEEWELALEHGIIVEVIPGVSSAIAVPGLAGIPLTFRGVSQSFAVITGHCREEQPEDWSRYARVDTLVVLMGVRNRGLIARSLIAAGRVATEPAAFIERGTLPSERIIPTTLAAIAEERVEVHTPAVLVIGDVVKLFSRLGKKRRAQLEPDPAEQA